MNANDFKLIIRKIVAEELASNETFKTVLREEIRRQFPKMFASVISETIANTKLTDVPESLDTPSVFAPTPASKPTPKKPVKYSNNPILNQVLNETVGGVPSESTMNVGLGSPMTMNESAMPPTIETMKQKEIGIYKDYRQLLKKVESNKSPGAAFGGMASGPLSIEPGITRTYETID
jgi:hypothetical protein